MSCAVIAEAPFEAPREIEQRDQEGPEDRVEGLLPELAADLRPDRLGALHLVRVGPVPLEERRVDAVGHRLGTALLLRYLPLILHADEVRGIRAELGDLLAVDPRAVDRRADVRGIGRRLEAHLHRRAAGELDAVVVALDRDQDHAGHDERERDGRRDPPETDEVDVGVVEDAQHQMLSVWMPFERLSQIR